MMWYLCFLFKTTTYSFIWQKSTQKIHPSIVHTAYLCRAVGRLEEIPADIQWHTVVHPVQGSSLSQGTRDQQVTHAHIHTYRQLRVVNLVCMCLICGGRTKNPNLHMENIDMQDFSVSLEPHLLCISSSTLPPSFSAGYELGLSRYPSCCGNTWPPQSITLLNSPWFC